MVQASDILIYNNFRVHAHKGLSHFFIRWTEGWRIYYS